MSERVCQGKDCNVSLEGEHGRRKWCSDLCRRRTSYTTDCKTCGAEVYDGSTTPPDECGECKYARTYEPRNERIFEAWEAGVPSWQIAEVESISQTAVTALVNHHRRHGRALTLRRKQNRVLWDQIAALYRDGVSFKEIGAELDLSTSSVGEYVFSMRRAGISLPYRKPQSNIRFPEQVPS